MKSDIEQKDETGVTTKKVAGSGYECKLSSLGDLTRFEKWRRVRG